MSTITPTLSIPSSIQVGLDTGHYTRFGGTIRETATGRIVAMLREVGPTLSPQVLNLLQLGSVASVLNLGVTTIGLAVVIKRLGDVEQRLQQAQEALRSIGVMLDISFFANVRAALDLAGNALTMSNAKNREASAMQAINRLVEARHHYTALTDTHLAQRNQVVDEYLATLTLAYVAEARCYLELEEIDAAQQLIRRGTGELAARARRHVETLLTTNPAAYLHPMLRGTVNLRRLTRVLRWLDPALDDNAVFETQRENLFNLANSLDAWIAGLPPAIWDPRVDQSDARLFDPLIGRIKATGWAANWLGSGDDTVSRVLKRLPAAMLTMEALIEDTQRFASYQAEVETIQRLSMSFQDWRQLALAEHSSSASVGLMWIVLPEPHEPATEHIGSPSGEAV